MQAASLQDQWGSTHLIQRQNHPDKSVSCLMSHLALMLPIVLPMYTEWKCYQQVCCPTLWTLLQQCLNWDHFVIAWFTSTRGVCHSLALCKQQLCRTNEGLLILNRFKVILTSLCNISHCPYSPHCFDYVHRMKMLSASLQSNPLNTVAFVSKLRLNSQLIPLHPNV